jgi:hypothetical protein
MQQEDVHRRCKWLAKDCQGKYNTAQEAQEDINSDPTPQEDSVLPLLLPFPLAKIVPDGDLVCNHPSHPILVRKVFTMATELLDDAYLYHLQGTLSNHHKAAMDHLL